MSRFVPIDRETAYLLPPSVDEWLPKDHLARFVLEVIEQLDLSDLLHQYAGLGWAAHHPAVLLGLLIYGYASGVHSSRKIERATYDSVAFRYVAANTQPPSLWAICGRCILRMANPSARTPGSPGTVQTLKRWQRPVGKRKSEGRA